MNIQDQHVLFLLTHLILDDWLTEGFINAEEVSGDVAD